MGYLKSGIIKEKIETLLSCLEKKLVRYHLSPTLARYESAPSDKVTELKHVLGAQNLSQLLLVNIASEQGQDQSSGLGLQVAPQLERRPKEQQRPTPAFATV